MTARRNTANKPRANQVEDQVEDQAVTEPALDVEPPSDEVVEASGDEDQAATEEPTTPAVEDDDTSPEPEPSPEDYPAPDAPITSGDVAPKTLEDAGGKTEDGRPKCRHPECVRPEVTDNAGLCGAHWALRPDLRKEARHD